MVQTKSPSWETLLPPFLFIIYIYGASHIVFSAQNILYQVVAPFEVYPHVIWLAYSNFIGKNLKVLHVTLIKIFYQRVWHQPRPKITYEQIFCTLIMKHFKVENMGVYNYVFYKKKAPKESILIQHISV